MPSDHFHPPHGKPKGTPFHHSVQRVGPRDMRMKPKMPTETGGFLLSRMKNGRQGIFSRRESAETENVL